MEPFSYYTEVIIVYMYVCICTLYTFVYRCEYSFNRIFIVSIFVYSYNEYIRIFVYGCDYSFGLSYL